MSNDLDVFHFEAGKESFENLGHSNGKRTWYARDLMQALGYENWQAFRAVINRAIGACMALDIDVSDNFEQVETVTDTSKQPDYKLTRFACYLVAMNGDPKKKNVAKAQVYFIAIAETFKYYLEESENVERVLVREEISEHEEALSGIAKQHGVIHYPFFQNAGYRGMYNTNLSQLKLIKGLVGKNSNRSLLDFMGKEELAANLFRVTQTESKIKLSGIHGQTHLEALAEEVGRQVRKAMFDISRTRPEDLPLAEDVKLVKKSIKQTHKKLNEIDAPQKKKGAG